MSDQHADYVAAQEAVTRAFVFARMGRPHLRRVTDAQFRELAGIAVAVLGELPRREES